MRQRRIASALLIVASFCLVVAQVHADEYLERMMHSIFDGLTSPSPEISTMTSTTTTTTTTTTPTPTPTTTTTTTTTTPTTTTMPTTTTTTENNVRDGIGYECVPHYLCQNGTITTNGAFVIESRFGGSCKFGEVLCAIPTTVKPEMKKMSIEKPPNEKRRRLVNRCGIRHRKGVGYRISSTSENQTEFGEFPWMVVIFRRSEDENNLTKYYACGGSIIHPQVVLTAAHCVQGFRAKQFKVRAGEWDTETDEELLPHQDRTVSEIVIHPDFYRPTLHYDFAIVFLSSPFEYADNVDIVCLPDRDDRFDGDRCSVTGWGKKSHVVERNYQNILKKVDLPVVPRNDCQTRLRKTRVGRYYILDKSFMCAGGEVGNDACKGDGGSPLVCPTGPRGTRYVQAGIVAGGIDCGTAGVPGLYGNVAFARDWIDGHMAAHNLDINVYRVPRII